MTTSPAMERVQYQPSELAYAHGAGARFSVGAPRWPVRVLFIESPSAPGHPVQSYDLHGVEIEGFTDAIGALLAMPTEQPGAIVAPTDMVHVDFLSFIDGMVAWTDVPVIVGLAPHDGAAELAYQAVSRGARAILGLPCRPEQLVGAVRACGVRAEAPPAKSRAGRIVVDADAFRVTVDDRDVLLTPRELLLVQYLVQAGQRVVRTDELAGTSASYDDGGVAATRVLVLRIRKKFEAVVPGSGALIETVRGIGYRIGRDAPSEAESPQG